jgi:hypothetical protein
VITSARDKYHSVLPIDVRVGNSCALDVRAHGDRHCLPQRLRASCACRDRATVFTIIGCV